MPLQHDDGDGENDSGDRDAQRGIDGKDQTERDSEQGGMGD